MIKFNFTKIHNGNDPRVFDCSLDDGVLWVKESCILKGGDSSVIDNFTANMECSLYHSKENQIKRYESVKLYYRLSFKELTKQGFVRYNLHEFPFYYFSIKIINILPLTLKDFFYYKYT